MRITIDVARFKANIVTLPYPGFEMPEYVLRRLQRDYGVSAVSRIRNATRRFRARFAAVMFGTRGWS